MGNDSFSNCSMSGKLHNPDCLQVLMYGAFVGELYAWFCLGEIVGRYSYKDFGNVT